MEPTTDIPTKKKFITELNEFALVVWIRYEGLVKNGRITFFSTLHETPIKGSSVFISLTYDVSIQHIFVSGALQEDFSNSIRLTDAVY